MTISGQYRAVVIGGGMLGVSTLYHLALEGWTDCLLIEKGEISSGSTWHAAGQCPHFVGSYSLMKVHDYGVQCFSQMEKNLGQPAGWHGCGGIRLAYSEQEISWFKHVQGIARLAGVAMDIIPPAEIAKIHPFLSLDGVLMGAQTFTDGHTDPSSGANGFVAGAKALGAEVSLRNRVLAISRMNDYWQVETEQGIVLAEHVINAAGSYGDAVARMVGTRVPLSNMVHQYLVTETIEALENRETELPVVRDPGCNAYLRQEQKGLLIGPYETADAEIVWREQNHPHWDFEMELLPENLDRIAPWLEKATRRLPLFAESGIKRVICGAITHTPDGNFLAGPAAGLENLWHATGCGIGIAQGPGVGKYLSQWIVHGEAEINMAAFDPRRFGDYAIGTYTEAKSVDDYQNMYTPHHPDDHRPAGRPVKTSALDATLRQNGGEMTEVHGWERALHYGGSGLVTEFRHGRNADFPRLCLEAIAADEQVALADLSSFSTFRITGADNEVFLDRLTPSRLPESHRARLIYLLNDHATFLGEWTLLQPLIGEFWVFGGAAAHATDTHLLQQAADHFSGQVEVEDRTEQTGSLLLTGPKSRQILATLSNQNFATEAFPWLACRHVEMAGLPVLLLRMSYAGTLGYEMHVARNDLPDLYRAVSAAAEAEGVRVAMLGTKALNSLRLEKGYPAFGSELTNEVTCHEANMTHFWDRSKTMFRGRDALLAAEGKPPRLNRVLLSLDLDACDTIGADAMGNEPIYSGDSVVGMTTSGAFGARVSMSLAYGYLDPAAASTPLAVLVQGERIAATILDRPPFDPDNTAIRQ